jgi:hypothetical protein
MALEHIKICPRGRYLILSDSLSSLMAMRSRRITCKTWVYESKQICWDLQQLNYDVKLMWNLSHERILGKEVADGLARQAVEIGTVHGQMTVANDHRILARQLDTGRFAHSIQPVVSVKPWFDGQAEERSFVYYVYFVYLFICQRTQV